MKIKEANEITGGLSAPSKMPGRAFNISAFACKRGSVLAEIEGSVCSSCYARKGRYLFNHVKNAQKKRLMNFDHPQFVMAMVTLINKQSPEFFRWFDSGDLQNEEMLQKILLICRLTPDTKHWLPTREYKIVSDYVSKYGMSAIPENLVIRFSGDFIDGAKPKNTSFPLSRVVKHSINPNAHLCPAPKQNNNCGDCRACWNKDVKEINYHEH